MTFEDKLQKLQDEAFKEKPNATEVEKILVAVGLDLVRDIHDIAEALRKKAAQ